MKSKKNALTVREIAVFAVMGALMFGSKKLMEFLPNIHLVGMLTAVCTIVFRAKALYPIYIYVFLDGLFGGFSGWWVPYLYIWTVLWAAVMLLPENMPKKAQYIVYPIVCCLHGLLFGVLYAPAYMVLMHMTPKAALAWVAAGIPFDLLHAVGNLAVGLLIVPCADFLRKILKSEK